MAIHNDLGRWGEQVAADYLETKGWFIRHRDWRNKHLDLDIVCIDEEMSMLLFVEVKTRSTDAFGDPDLAIDLQKKNNILRAAAKYVRDYRLEHLELRYDTISVVGTPGNIKKVEHKENAFDVFSNYLFYEQMRHRYHRRSI